MMDPLIFPSYNELVKTRRKQERREKRRRFWQGLKCRLGRHHWQAYWRGSCKVWMGGVFMSSPVQTDAQASLQQCKYCPAERAEIDNGFSKQAFDPDYIKRGIQWQKESSLRRA